jgi:hemoglobin
MKLAVWDTYVQKEDGVIMHFDILVPENITDTKIIYEYGEKYLKSKGLDLKITSSDSNYCHLEEMNSEQEKEIIENNYIILEMENCKNLKRIENREDIELLVNTFYDEVRKNDILGFIFDDVAKVNWDSHLPKLYSFWSSILLGENSFRGNPMIVHIGLSKMTDMTEVQFNEWVKLFTKTVDSLFEGSKAEEAKIRASNIAQVMLSRIESF